MNKLVAVFIVLLSGITIVLDANAITCSDLDGSYVYSQEYSPTYLGFFGSAYAAESIMNTYGTYGSSYGTYSVRNEYGSYGSPYASYSANNPYTSTPPKIYKYGYFIGYLTTGYSSPGVSLEDIDSSCTFYASNPYTGPPPAPPLPPAQVNASDGTYIDKIAVSWSAVSGATAYNIYISDTYLSPLSFLGQSEQTSANITGSEPGVIRYIWIYSVNANGVSTSGTYDTGYVAEAPEPLPLPPNQVTASDGSYSDKVVVSWSTVSNATAYNVYVSDTLNSPKTYLGQDTESPGSVTGLEPGIVQYFWVFSVNATGESGTGNYDTGYIAVTPPATVPDAPTLTSAIPANHSALLWFTANGDGGSTVTSYTATCGVFSQVGSSSPITVSGLTNGTQYSCSVIATNAEGASSPSNALSVTPTVVSNVNNELRNIATRAEVRTGNEILIGGFVIVGSTPKCVVIQGLGGSVAVPDGVTRLADPTLELKSGLTTIAQNDNWQVQDNPADVQAIQDAGRAPDDMLEAAIYMCLDPGAYTALVRGYQQSTGLGMVAVYDADDSSPYLKNIATRSWVGTQHAISIAGFVVTGNTPKQILIRGLGPSMQERFPQLGALSDPQLRLYQGPNIITTNDDWGDAANAAEIAALAAPLPPTHPKEPAILMTLQPGLYTAHMLGVGGETGIGNVAVYDLTGRQ